MVKLRYIVSAESRQTVDWEHINRAVEKAVKKVQSISTSLEGGGQHLMDRVHIAFQIIHNFVGVGLNFFSKEGRSVKQQFFFRELKPVKQLWLNQLLSCVPLYLFKRLIRQRFKVPDDVHEVTILQVHTLVVLGLFVNADVYELLLEGESVPHLIEEEG